jgi:iron complex outermembrane receptor protein
MKGQGMLQIAQFADDAQYGIPSDTTYIDMRQTKVMTRSSFALGSGLLKSLSLDGSYANYSHDDYTEGE